MIVEQTCQCGAQLEIVVDHGIRTELGDRNICIAERNSDDRDTGCSGGLNVRHAIADHNRAARVTSSEPDRPKEMVRMRLADGKRVPSGDSAKQWRQAKLAEKLTRELFALVGANGKHG